MNQQPLLIKTLRFNEIKRKIGVLLNEPATAPNQDAML
jgi:hypothetical protein